MLSEMCTERWLTKSWVLLLLGLLTSGVFSCFAQEERPGFKDTPMLPGEKWHVHDPDRPYPPVVTPGTSSLQEAPGRAPSDAVVLFDGKDLSAWMARKDGKLVSPGWKVEEGYFNVVRGAGGLVSKEKFGDCQIHIEWATPTEVTKGGQGRGNSGVLIMGHYEIQVLDSYLNSTYADGQAAAMYGQYPPLVNASLPPGAWQTYDIVFEAPKWEGQKLVKPAIVTVFQNGILVHHRKPFIGRMVYRDLATYTPHEKEGPLVLQDHGDPVRYRNIWVRRLKGSASQ